MGGEVVDLTNVMNTASRKNGSGLGRHTRDFSFNGHMAVGYLYHIVILLFTRNNFGRRPCILKQLEKAGSKRRERMEKVVKSLNRVLSYS